MKQSNSHKRSVSKGTHGVLVRMPVDLHEELKDLAERETRPVNAQIVHVIQVYIEAQKATA